MDIKDFEILTNERSKPNDFKMNYKCTYCDNFQSQLLKVPIYHNYDNVGVCAHICKTCLTKMIERLDQNMLENMEMTFLTLLTCKWCGWEGYSEELVVKTANLDGRNLSYCPDCGNHKFEEEKCEVNEIIIDEAAPIDPNVFEKLNKHRKQQKHFVETKGRNKTRQNCHDFVVDLDRIGKDKEVETDLGKHDFYKTTDKDCPIAIKIRDRNGDVALKLCKVCGGVGATLPTACPGRKLTQLEKDGIKRDNLDFVIYRKTQVRPRITL